MYRNSEGYADPTVGAALAHIEYEERLKRRKAERRRRNTEKERQDRILQNNQHSFQSSNIHWVKVWPKESEKNAENMPGGIG